MASELQINSFPELLAVKTIRLQIALPTDSYTSPPPKLTIGGNLLSLLLLNDVGSARLRESDVDPMSPKTPAPQYQLIDRKKRKGKIVEDYSRDRAAQANTKTLTLLLKPASPSPSNTGSARSFQRDNERGTKVLRYSGLLFPAHGPSGMILHHSPFCSEVAHRYTDVRPDHRVCTRAGTYGSGSASLSWLFVLHRILYSIQRTATDQP